jgi:tetratricopeptide (TPR) repeat protein
MPTRSPSLPARPKQIFGKQPLGPTHPDVAVNCLNNFGGTLYRAKGNYIDAEPLYQRALAIRETYLGPIHHPHVGSKPQQPSVQLYIGPKGSTPTPKPSLPARPGDSGTGLGAHPSSMSESLNNLARPLSDPRAVPQRRAPLPARPGDSRTGLGANHPDVAKSLNNLGELYRAQGQYTDAEPLYQRALAILGTDLGARPSLMSLRASTI